MTEPGGTRDPPEPPRCYATTVTDVREVALFGTADLDAWSGLLAGENLVPYARSGHAEVLIMACAGSFLGVRYSELSVSVAVSRQGDGLTRDGVFLAQAFNSVRFFAFVERAVFRAPYLNAEISVATSPRVSMAVRESGRTLLRADMAECASAATGAVDDGWEGVVFLPRGRVNGDRPGKFFYARIHGPTRSQPFSPATDRIDISPGERHRVLGFLATSDFTGTEWHVRESAVHARSRSYPRG